VVREAASGHLGTFDLAAGWLVAATVSSSRRLLQCELNMAEGRFVHYIEERFPARIRELSGLSRPLKNCSICYN
jgi:hypothetical protein